MLHAQSAGTPGFLNPTLIPSSRNGEEAVCHPLPFGERDSVRGEILFLN